jgi:hypothetical protein
MVLFAVFLTMVHRLGGEGRTGGREKKRHRLGIEPGGWRLDGADEPRL